MKECGFSAHSTSFSSAGIFLWLSKRLSECGLVAHSTSFSSAGIFLCLSKTTVGVWVFCTFHFFQLCWHFFCLSKTAALMTSQWLGSVRTCRRNRASKSLRLHGVVGNSSSNLKGSAQIRKWDKVVCKANALPRRPGTVRTF